MTDHDRLAALDAAYAMGALDAADEAEFESHMAGCGECRARVSEARDTLALLGAADAGLALIDEPVPDTLLPSMLRRIGRDRRRRRALTAGAVAVAAACLATLLVVFWPGSSGSDPVRPAAATRDFTVVTASPVRANGVLVAKQWGTQIDVHCAYAMGEKSAYPYQLRVIAADGSVDSLGSWIVPPTGDVSFVAGTSVDLVDISKVQILRPDGTPVLELAN